MPVDKTATLLGRLKFAKTPWPFADPTTPLPASVLTKLPGVMDRIIWSPLSATNTVPVDDTATPRGPLKLATAPWPFADPAAPLPASAVVFEMHPGVENKHTKLGAVELGDSSTVGVDVLLLLTVNVALEVGDNVDEPLGVRVVLTLRVVLVDGVAEELGVGNGDGDRSTVGVDVPVGDDVDVHEGVGLPLSVRVLIGVEEPTIPHKLEHGAEKEGAPA